MNVRNVKPQGGDGRFEPQKRSSSFAIGSGRSSFQLIMMVIVLILLIGLMLFLRHYGTSAPVPASEAPVSLENLTYYNRLYNFALQAPSTDWEITYRHQVDSLRQENVASSVFDNINPMLEMRRRNGDSVIAVVEIGVIDLASPRTPQGLAMKNLQEVQHDFRTARDTVRIIQAVTPISHGIMEGAYFMVEVPKPVPQPIWINTFWVRNQLGYSMLLQTTKADYTFLRDDLESIIGSFRHLQ
jgi:hypothetical protein